MKIFAKITLSSVLLVGGFVVLFVGMLTVGTWISRTIQDRVVHHEGEVFALYLDSIVSDYVDSIATGGQLTSTDIVALDKLFLNTKIGERIVSFKIWSRDGLILYNTNLGFVGRQFDKNNDITMAFLGETESHILATADIEHHLGDLPWEQLVETYAPIRRRKTGVIVAVAEIFQTTDVVANAIGSAKWRSWVFVATATLAMYILLALLIRDASSTIAAQRHELHEKVTQLTLLLAQNAQLHERVRRAGARTAALNERFLHRIAADLHDGPAQGLALALMRIEALAEACNTCPQVIARGRTVNDEFRALHAALQSSHVDLRAIAAGLPLPEIEPLSIAETAQRAVRDYEYKSGLAVTLTVDETTLEVPLAVKITLYRLLQESLANGFRHGAAANQRVKISRVDEQLVIEVADSGKGFDPMAELSNSHLGLGGMRERAEILGGTFNVQSEPGSGTIIRAVLPLRLLEE